MVLFKRKPVQYLQPPVIEDENVEVWEIEATEEVFTDYEAYLNRMDFYKQRRFICQITGHSGLNFFDALKSEQAGAQEVEEAFPEALKGPILRRVQFQTISRIDNLVDILFDEFRSDYYPGEAVTVHVISGERLTGIVRDKTRFGGKPLPDGSFSAPFSRYFVSLDNRPTEEAVVDDAHITRDRKIFTKQVLRSFIKKTVTRESWTGAPWLVKPEYANLYHIDTRVPPNLRYENKAAERKQQQAQRKSVPEFDGMVSSFQGDGPSKLLPELKPAPKSHKSKAQQAAQAAKQGKNQMMLTAPQQAGPHPPQFIQHPQHPPPPPHPFVSHTFPTNGGPPRSFHPPPPNFPFTPVQQPMPAPPPPPPPIKYPCDDLDIPPRISYDPRPPMKFFSQDTPVPVDNHPAEGNGILMKSVGPLLETWDTLNVYCEVFKLDSFTFDDFVEAMQFTSEDVECELLVETHCAALKLLVQGESEGGRVQIQLPEMDPEVDEDSVMENSVIPTPTPEPEPKPSGRTTRSSLAKAEAAALQEEAAKSPTPEPKQTHLAAEFVANFDWIGQLKKRDFKNGGWQAIIVGLLYQLSKNPRYEKSCGEILAQLMPVGKEPTQETVRLQYNALDVNLRIQALQIICMLTAATRAIRGYMEECSEQMTAFRKEKINWQRERKQTIEELRQLNEERKTLLPADVPPGPELPKANGDVKMGGTADTEPEEEEEVVDTDEDAQPASRALRRGTDRAAERQRKREEEEEKKAKAEAAAKLPKPSKQLQKVLKEIQKKEELIKKCEAEIAVIDNDLREADCPRTRVLGKDRFWNRYYWFERNGMPYGGLPTSSTAEAGYANGCLWVQGPDDMEREGYIEFIPRNEREDHKLKFRESIPERKRREEGGTSVFTAFQWGYFDEPESVRSLLAWLDPRGFNEVKLRKELLNYADHIIERMEKRKKYLAGPQKAEEGQQEEEKKEEPVVAANKRSSGRVKHVKEAEQEKKDLSSVHRCLAWRNTTAMEELGHLHSDQPRARKPVKKAVVIEERETRSEAKGKKEKPVKPLGRQGTRYNF